MFSGRVRRGLFNQGQTQSGRVIELALNQLLGEGCCIHLDFEDKTVLSCRKISEVWIGPRTKTVLRHF